MLFYNEERGVIEQSETSETYIYREEMYGSSKSTLIIVLTIALHWSWRRQRSHHQGMSNSISMRIPLYSAYLG